MDTSDSRVTATFEFHPDGRFERHYVVGGGEVKLSVPGACLPLGDCSLLESDDGESICTGDPTIECMCTITAAEEDHDTGTYRVMGNEVTITMDDGVTQRATFCASATTLAITDDEGTFSLVRD